MQARQIIHKQFWQLNYNERRNFMFSRIKKTQKKQSTVGLSGHVSRRDATFGYTFAVSNSGNNVNVCKVFFLTTLRYHPKNDAVITSLMKATPIGALTACEDRREKHPQARKSDGDAIKEHIYSYNFQISHYRRKHAPLRKYLPSDITVTDMHKDLVEKYPHKKCCYQSYRKHVHD